MRRLTDLAHDVVRSVLKAGEVAIDATAGNGRDTNFLAECVGTDGHVFALDIQSEAIRMTRAVVGSLGNISLLQRDHAELRDAIPSEFHGRVGAVMFNLGYRPGGDKSVVTRAQSTIVAISAGLELLRDGGVTTVLAYTGHAGGLEEAEAVGHLLNGLPSKFTARVVNAAAGVGDPQLFVVTKGN